MGLVRHLRGGRDVGVDFELARGRGARRPALPRIPIRAFRSSAILVRTTCFAVFRKSTLFPDGLQGAR